MKLIRYFAAVALIVAANSTVFPSAFAADPVFPPGARVGMTPLVGLNKARTFIGFETEDQGVKVLVTDLPAEAYGEVANAFKANPGRHRRHQAGEHRDRGGARLLHRRKRQGNAKDGATSVRRYSMILPGPTFSGYVAVQVPENAAKIYTDDAVRQMFASAVIRKEVPVEEQLGLMPFKISELSSFKNIRTLAPGAALILSDGDEKTGFEAAPFMIIGMIGSTAASPDDRGRFAQQIATTIPGVRDGRITMSEPVRIDGQPGYETRIDAISGKDNTPVTDRAVVAVRRPDLDAHHRLVAARRLDQGLSALPRGARRHSSARLIRKFARRAETSGFRSYTNGTSLFAVGFHDRGDAPCLLAGWF